jgi:hypothetical protein
MKRKPLPPILRKRLYLAGNEIAGLVLSAPRRSTLVDAQADLAAARAYLGHLVRCLECHLRRKSR